MKRLKDYNSYKVFEKSTFNYSVKLNWWIGDEDNIISTFYHTDYDNNKMQEFLNNIQLVSAKYIMGNRNEGISENSINLPKNELMIFMDMVDELIPKLYGKYREEITEGDFGIDDFLMRDAQKDHTQIDADAQNEYYIGEIKKLKEILNSELKPIVIFHLLKRRLKLIEDKLQKQA